MAPDSLTLFEKYSNLRYSVNMSETKKTCSVCKVEKTFDNFYFRKNRNNYRTQCKNCMSDLNKQYRSCNKEKIAARSSELRQLNKEKILAQEAEYRQCNKERIKEYYRNRHNNNANAKLAQNTRTRINTALKGKSKSFHTKEILGIDIENYKKWLLFQMTPEMNFNNIHIDHVKPISSFDISNDNELLEAFNWRNTQPLLKQDNLRKSNKFNEEDYNNQFVKAREFNLLQTFLSGTNLL